jgi:hypothetical protein
MDVCIYCVCVVTAGNPSKESYQPSVRFKFQNLLFLNGLRPEILIRQGRRKEEEEEEEEEEEDSTKMSHIFK